MEPIIPIGRRPDGPPPVAPINRLTPIQREEAAREREKRRRERERRDRQPSGEDTPPEGGGLLDVRA